MTRVVILGAGELGGALARQLAAADLVRRVVLVDGQGKVADGKALDIRQSAPIDCFATIVTGTTDESVAIDADAVIVADAASAGEYRDDAGVALVRRTSHINRRALFLCAGGQQMTIVERAVREGGLDRTRLLGSAPEALRSAVIGLTALEAGCAPADIVLTVLGRPPGHIIVPWDEASIAGRRASDVLTPPAITRLETRIPRLWPPGPLALASGAVRLLAAAVGRGHQTVSAFVVSVRGEGRLDRVAMLPVTMAATRLGEVRAPTLSARDRVRLETVL